MVYIYLLVAGKNVPKMPVTNTSASLMKGWPDVFSALYFIAFLVDAKAKQWTERRRPWCPVH